MRPSDRGDYLSIAALVLLSRLPFIFNGIGTDLDASYEIFAGKMIAEFGTYQVSRFPGYPFSEFLYALMNGLPFWCFNLVTVLFTLGTCLLFLRLLKVLEILYAWWLSLAFSFLPIVYLNSTVSMNYIFSTFFLLAAFYYLLNQKLGISACFFGLMVCSRFNNIIYFPLFIALCYVQDLGGIKKCLLYALYCGCFTLLFFSPVIIRYKGDFFHPGSSESVALIRLISMLSMYQFGLIGSFAFLSIILLQVRLWRKVDDRSFVSQTWHKQKAIVCFCIALISFTLLLFLKYPLEPAYLIPLHPFLLIIVGLFFRPICTLFLSFSFLLSPFLLYVSATSFKLKGMIFVYQNIEEEFPIYFADLNNRINRLPPNSIVCLADFYEQTRIFDKVKLESPEKVVRYINGESVLELKKSKVQIYYLPFSNVVNKEKVGIDLSKNGRLLKGDLTYER